MEELIAAVPARAQAMLRRLIDGPDTDAATLRAEVEAYRASVSGMASSRPFVDVEAADAIAAACLALLDAARSERDKRLVQIACLYFVAIDDDVDGALGFEDDAKVVGMVAGLIGRPELAP